MIDTKQKETTEEETVSFTKEEKYFRERILSEDYETVKQILSTKKEEPRKIWSYKTEENDGSTILHLAIFYNHYKIIKAILNYSQKNLPKPEFLQFIEKKNNKGITSLHYASFRGNIKVLHYLLNQGANIKVLTNKKLSVIHFACQGNRPNSLAYFYYYHRKKINFELKDKGGSTPLHWACYSKALEAVNYLLSWGIKVNIQDNEGNTPLHLAIISGAEKIVRILLQNGASVRIKNKKNISPFELAQENEKKNSIFEILKSNKKCSVINFRAPAKKIKKSRRYIFILVFFQLLSCLILLFVIFPFLVNQLFYFPLIGSYLGISLVYFIVYSWLLFSNPGIMKTNKDLDIKKIIFNKNEDLKNYCIKCFVKTTNTSKHCVICDKCCEEFDHHCFWVNNCIGKNNYKVFFSFLFLSFIDLFLIFLIAIYAFVLLFFTNDLNSNDNDNNNKLKKVEDSCPTKVSLSDIWNILKFPACLDLWEFNNLYREIFCGVLIFIIGFFMVPLIYLLKLHLGVLIFRIKQNKPRNTRLSLLNPDTVNTDDLLVSDGSDSTSNSLDLSIN